MVDFLTAPLQSGPPSEIALANAPLERVLAQVRFPPILKIDDRSQAARFQELVRGDYPILNELENQIVHIEITPGQGPVPTARTAKVWQFCNFDNSWRAAIASDSMSLETSSYSSRADFLERWHKLLDALDHVFQPQVVDRIGMRYIDRIDGEHYHRFDEMIAPQLIGSAFSRLKPAIRQSTSESILAVPEGQLLLRFGVLPANATFDPGAYAPKPTISFFLDIDVSAPGRRKFELPQIKGMFRAFAERAYTVFRFSVTNEFLDTFGAAR